MASSSSAHCQQPTPATNSSNQLQQPTPATNSSNQRQQPTPATSASNQRQQPAQATSPSNQPKQPAPATSTQRSNQQPAPATSNQQPATSIPPLSPLRTSDFDYVLPPDRIAQQPNEQREASRLLVVDRAAGSLEHRVFADLPELVPGGDALVLNTSRVIRARLLGRRDTGAPAEILLLRPVEGPHVWEALVHPGGKLHPGRLVTIAPGLEVAIERLTDRRSRIVRLLTTLEPYEAIERFGHIPLPPYIHRPDGPADVERYQTVFAREPGSVAAPTAGLHFSQPLLDTLSHRGVRRAEVVLHVGAGTFKPVETEDPALHRMHEEWFSVSDTAAQTLNETRRAGGHCWAVGTTVARTLETAVQPDGSVAAMSGETALFIRPPYTWRAVDRLITNFHLPRSTLLMLVAAFAGRELVLEAYRVALEQGYRFYSYGDAMLIR